MIDVADLLWIQTSLAMTEGHSVASYVCSSTSEHCRTAPALACVMQLGSLNVSFGRLMCECEVRLRHVCPLHGHISLSLSYDVAAQDV